MFVGIVGIWFFRRLELRLERRIEVVKINVSRESGLLGVSFGRRWR